MKPKKGQNMPDDYNANRIDFEADVLQANMTNTFRDASLERENIQLKATLAVIRENVELLMAGRYMPMPHAILDALYPNERQILYYTDSHDQGEFNGC